MSRKKKVDKIKYDTEREWSNKYRYNRNIKKNNKRLEKHLTVV